jgi:RecJ-like exonuclease
MSRLIVVLVGVVCLLGCSTGPPVQEMSDARQAIVAAAAAGAIPGSSPEYDAAQAAIGRAEKHLQAQQYERARLAALQAKRHAAIALANAQRAEASAAPVPH